MEDAIYRRDRGCLVGRLGMHVREECLRYDMRKKESEINCRLVHLHSRVSANQIESS